MHVSASPKKSRFERCFCDKLSAFVATLFEGFDTFLNFDVFQNLLNSFKVHASDMACSLGLEQGCSSYTLSNSVLSCLPRIGQGTVLGSDGFHGLEAQLFDKAPARAGQWRIDHIGLS